MITTSDEMDINGSFPNIPCVKRTSFGRHFGQVSIWDERNPNTTAALAMMSPNSSTFLALLCRAAQLAFFVVGPGSATRSPKKKT